MDRDRHLALLADQHTFPGPFTVRAFTRPEGRAAVVSAVQAALGTGEALSEVTERASRSGTWVALHLTVDVADPEAVLRVYDVLHALDEVVQTL